MMTVLWWWAVVNAAGIAAILMWQFVKDLWRWDK